VTEVGRQTNALEAQITELWDRRGELTPADGDARAIVDEAIDLLDRGEVRTAEIDAATGEVVVNAWLKQAILLLFRLAAMRTIELGPFEYADRIPLKKGFAASGVRAVPGASARWGSFLEPGVVLMPSYVNIGARVGAETMVDTWATVGSCAQVGARVHLSGGVGIGGVLEPPQAAPVIVGDDALVGSRCMVVEGARVGQGAVLGAGLILSSTIPVIDAETGESLGRGVIPPWCVAVMATRPRAFPGGEFGLPCALVVKRLAEGERHDKAQLEAVLRQHGVTGA
jgi:2,3,4,5-tetrahydropyridine-2-carboxylate N-succinyltransferase